jgi:hypothetical protein
MIGRASIVERAFALAESGSCDTIERLRRCLLREGSEQVDSHLAGTFIRRQLLERMAMARDNSEPANQESV